MFFSEAPAALLISGLFMLLAFCTHLLHVRGNYEVEVTRKIFHTGGGILALFLPVLFSQLLFPLVLCTMCAVALLLSKQGNQFAALNATERNTWGAPLFPLAVLLTLVISRQVEQNQLVLYVSALGTLTFADSAAALAGNFPRKAPTTQKTLRGSIAFFLCALLVNIAACLLLGDPPYSSSLLWSVALLASGVGTFAELLSRRGFDNLWVPLVVAGVHILGAFVSSRTL